MVFHNEKKSQPNEKKNLSINLDIQSDIFILQDVSKAFLLIKRDYLRLLRSVYDPFATWHYLMTCLKDF